MSDISKTGERMLPEKVRTSEEYIMYVRHMFAYEFSTEYLQKDFEILDFGCGTGYGTYFLSQFVKRIIGVDVDSKVISYAESKYGSNNCVFECYDGNNLPFSADKFDGIVSFQVIEHVEDDRLYLDELCKSLKPGGVLVLSTPNKATRLKPNQKPFNKFHLREYYWQELKILLEEKFQTVDIFGVSAKDEIIRMEMKRIDRAQSNLKNPFKKLIPAKIRTAFKNKLNELRENFKSLPMTQLKKDKVNVKDFFLIKEQIDSALDLLAVCKK